MNQLKRGLMFTDSSFPTILIGVIIFIIIAAFNSRIKKANTRRQAEPTAPASTPQKAVQAVLVGVILLAFIGYFFTQTSILLWVGVGAILILDIVNGIKKFQNRSGKPRTSDQAVNEQPVSAPFQSAPKQTSPQLYPQQNQVNPSADYSPTRNNSIDYFGDAGKGARVAVLIFVALIIIIGTALLVLYVSGDLTKFLP
jgi:hypothetical protein